MNELTLTPSERAAVLGVLCELDPMRRGLPEDLRQWKRRALAQPLWIYRLRPASHHQPQVFRAVTTDVSPRGVGLFSKVPFAVGDRFILPVHFDDGGRLYLCLVTNVRRSPSGFHSVGAQFLAAVEQPYGAAPQIPPEWLDAQ